jgi:translocation and assembly module TamA
VARPSARCTCTLLALYALTLRPAQADVDIDVRGVNEQLRNNVMVYLSLSRYQKRPLDATTVERLQNRIEREVKEALRPFGYYEPIVKSDITPRQKNDWHAVIQIDPGQPLVMQNVEVRVTGPGADDRLFQRILQNLPLHVGDRLQHAAYEQIKGDLQRTAATYGYLDAQMRRSELQVDPANHRASAYLTLETGPRYTFGATSIDQNVVKDALVRRYMRYKEHDPFDLTQLLRTQFALDDSQYFSTVEVLPGQPDRQAHTVPVNIRAEANRRDRYSFGGGYGTDTGPRGTFLWERHRVNDSGHRFSTQVTASEQILLLQSVYTIPIGDPALERLSFGATADATTPGDLHNKDFSLGPSLTRVIGRWQYVFALTPTHSITDDGITTRTDNLLIPSITLASVPVGYLGEPLFERGIIAELRGASHYTGSTESFLQLHILGERSFPIAPKWHLLLRGELGTSLVSKLSELPGSMRFFAGGDQSVRGFAFDDLSPVVPRVNPDGTVSLLKVGGRHVLTGTVEVVRELPRNLGVATFVDAGNAFDVFGRSPNPAYPHFIEYSVGVGVRYRLPIATFGLDIAQALSRSGVGPRFHINFSPKL